MKTIKILIVMLFFGVARASAQSEDLTQLILDIEKLSQLKGILTDMKTGYDIINGGYNEVKQIASGNLNIHTVFLNGLLAINPEIAKYGRVADIVLKQGYIVTEYQRYYSRFRNSGTFNSNEIGYMGNVYTTLLEQSLQNLSQLTNVLAAGKLRMSDDDRLKAIDRIYADTDDKLNFLRHFNQQAAILDIQRQHELNNYSTLQKLY